MVESQSPLTKQFDGSEESLRAIFTKEFYDYINENGAYIEMGSMFKGFHSMSLYKNRTNSKLEITFSISTIYLLDPDKINHKKVKIHTDFAGIGIQIGDIDIKGYVNKIGEKPYPISRPLEISFNINSYDTFIKKLHDLIQSLCANLGFELDDFFEFNSDKYIQYQKEGVKKMARNKESTKGSILNLLTNSTDIEDIESLIIRGNGISLDDVVLDDDLRQDLENLFVKILYKKELVANGGAVSKGVLLLGGPGVGKTEIVRALASNENIIVFKLDKTDYGSPFIHQGSMNLNKKLSTIQEYCKKKGKHGVIFLDECDSVISTKGSAGQHYSDELNALLKYMDGVGNSDEITIFAATNTSKANLESAALRPGRFEEHYIVSLPNEHQRKQLFLKHIERKERETGKKIFAENLDIDLFAKESGGFTGATIRKVLDDACNSVFLTNKKGGNIAFVSDIQIMAIIKKVKEKIKKGFY